VLKVREPIAHVIDDDAALRESFQVLLELLAGIKVHTYSSAEEFLHIDLDMPGFSGVDLLDQLRVSGIPTPALFVTGRRVTEDLRLVADRLRAALFEKPMLPQELISAVREALG
jgi:FixJ family two-component response regulator